MFGRNLHSQEADELGSIKPSSTSGPQLKQDAEVRVVKFPIRYVMVHIHDVGLVFSDNLTHIVHGITDNK